jgi:hypothetical protein
LPLIKSAGGMYSLLLCLPCVLPDVGGVVVMCLWRGGKAALGSISAIDLLASSSTLSMAWNSRVASELFEFVVRRAPAARTAPLNSSYRYKLRKGSLRAQGPNEGGLSAPTFIRTERMQHLEFSKSPAQVGADVGAHSVAYAAARVARAMQAFFCYHSCVLTE